MCFYSHRLLPGVALPIKYSFCVYRSYNLNELPCHMLLSPSWSPTTIVLHSPGRSLQGSQSSRAVPPTQNHLCRTAWTEILRILYVAFKPIFVLQLERFYSLSSHCIGWGQGTSRLTRNDIFREELFWCKIMFCCVSVCTVHQQLMSHQKHQCKKVKVVLFWFQIKLCWCVRPIRNSMTHRL